MAEEAERLASPRISIIVPVYKVEQYLRRCLDSIAAQTFTDWECILIDDGSPDASGIICDEYAARDARFRVIHQENRGVSAARNAGLDAAKGEWIGFVDSDDWVDADYIEQLLTAAITAGADISVCGVEDVGEHHSYSKNKKDVRDWHTAISDIFLNRIHGALYCYLIKKDLFDKNSIRFPDGINICEDVIVCIQLLTAMPKTTYVDTYPYHYFVENYSSIAKSKFSEEKCYQLVAAVEKMESILIEKSLYDEYIPSILFRRKYIKLKILYKSSLLTGLSFYKLYPGLSKSVKVNSLSNLFQKVLLFNTEIRNIPLVWLCLLFFKIFWSLKKRK